MNKPLSETVIYLLILAAIVVFNYLRPRFSRWLKAQEGLARAEQERAQARAPPDEHSPSAAPDYALPPAASYSVPPKAMAVPAAPRAVATARAYLADRSQLRQAIVVATVLGPCRAQELPDDREYRVK